MSPDFLKRQLDKPLYPKMLWSRPETVMGAGKLLIIGGQAQEFIHVAESYALTEKAGAGTIRVFMPDSTQRVTKMLPNIEYASSNPSGSFARNALAELLDASQWADGILLAGDLGKNSETSLMLADFLKKYTELAIITSLALESFTEPLLEIFNRPQTVIVCDFNDIQKFGIALQIETPITSEISQNDFAEILHKISSSHQAHLVINCSKDIWTAVNGQVTVTKKSKEHSIIESASHAAVWLIQNPGKSPEALPTAAYCL